MLIRSVRSAICTSGEPVSVSWRRYSPIVAEVSGIVRFVLFRRWPWWAGPSGSGDVVVATGWQPRLRQLASLPFTPGTGAHSAGQGGEMPASSYRRWILPAALAAVVGAIVPAGGPPAARAAAPTPTVAHADLVGTDGKPAGSVVLTTAGDHLRVEVAATGLSPGFHGLHLHAVGQCDPGAGPVHFTSAGGHLGSDAAPHSGHAGDLPSLYARADGVGRARFLTDRVTLAQSLDAAGSAVVVHAGRDNFANIPGRYQSPDSALPGPDSTTLAGGDSGDRALCGVVTAGPAAPPGGYLM